MDSYFNVYGCILSPFQLFPLVGLRARSCKGDADADWWTSSAGYSKALIGRRQLPNELCCFQTTPGMCVMTSQKQKYESAELFIVLKA